VATCINKVPALLKSALGGGVFLTRKYFLSSTNVHVYAAKDWLSLSVGGLSFFGIGGGNGDGKEDGRSDFVIIKI
jgi:hypothetical protein